MNWEVVKEDTVFRDYEEVLIIRRPLDKRRKLRGSKYLAVYTTFNNGFELSFGTLHRSDISHFCRVLDPEDEVEPTQREPIWKEPELSEWGDSEFDFDPDQGAK